MSAQSSPNVALPRPHDIVAALGRVIIGQDDAKKGLALAVYKHVLGLAASEGSNEPIFGQQHVLLVGPTGCGKTRMVQELGKIVDLPVATCSATSLVEVGYTGEQVHSLVERLLAAAGGNTALAGRGIVFLDEIDKKRRSGGDHRDVSGESVQQSLLKLMDGVDVTVGRGEHTATVSTRGVMFICAGAFPDLDDARKRHLVEPGIGFSAPSSADSDALRQGVRLRDLVDYGMIPEFIGRFATIRELAPLTLSELERVLVEPEGSVLRRTAEFFLKHGTRLQVSGEAVRAMARRAVAMGSGARALERVAIDVVEPAIWRLLRSSRHVRRAVITKDTVEHRQRARFHYSEAHDSRCDADALVRGGLEIPRATDQPGITDTRGWTDDQLRERIKTVVAKLGVEEAVESARNWWHDFESENELRPRVVLRLAEELAHREATVSEFFFAYVHSNSVNPQAVLHYMDYWRLKEQENRGGPGSGGVPIKWA